jgi:hypothetical protein
VGLKDRVRFVDDGLVPRDELAEGEHVGKKSWLSLSNEAKLLISAGINALLKKSLRHTIPLSAAADDERGDVTLKGGELAVVWEVSAVDFGINVEWDGIIVRHPTTPKSSHCKMAKEARLIIEYCSAERNIIIEFGDNIGVFGMGLGVTDIENAL